MRGLKTTSITSLCNVVEDTRGEPRWIDISISQTVGDKDHHHSKRPRRVPLLFSEIDESVAGDSFEKGVGDDGLLNSIHDNQNDGSENLQRNGEEAHTPEATQDHNNSESQVSHNDVFQALAIQQHGGNYDIVDDYPFKMYLVTCGKRARMGPNGKECTDMQAQYLTMGMRLLLQMRRLTLKSLALEILRQSLQQRLMRVCRNLVKILGMLIEMLHNGKDL